MNVTRVRSSWLIGVLTIWALAPIAMLSLRAAAPAWLFPEVVPRAVDLWTVVDMARRPRLTSALGTSAALALLTGLASTVVGFLMARIITRAPAGARHLAMALALFTVIVPPIALGVGLQVALLSLGLGGTVAGVLLAHLVPATGYLTLFGLSVFSSADLTLDDEARTLGASWWQVWARVTIPMLRGRVAEAVVLGGLVSWGQLATTLLIGGGAVRTLPVEALSLVQSGNDQLGSLSALLLTLPPMAAIGLLRAGVNRAGTGL